LASDHGAGFLDRIDAFRNFALSLAAIQGFSRPNDIDDDMIVDNDGAKAVTVDMALDFFKGIHLCSTNNEFGIILPIPFGRLKQPQQRMKKLCGKE